MDEVIIYSDGGCSPNPGPGGWGAVLISSKKPDKTKELCGGEKDTTNNRMELTAAIKALEALKRPCKVHFHTDSQYLQKAFVNGWLEKWQKKGWKTAGKKPVKNKDLWVKLLELTETHDVHWTWVRGHCGVEYNELCDRLAAKGREKLNG
ncbi:ribonuclease HI [Sedimentisphaera salicampi]|uniref:ribonuclease HI n=1 Tax=Sedimentisphaera salicampi TaxID=1941349 RepID=UPI000B9B3189|nr:ribonuclease HI [Sedimentisphaera salicampi]OXU13937.1 Ribonuclease H [Sedimentisphaera salicampi]